MATIVGPHIERQNECEAILRSLPEWFGIEESMMNYVRDSARMPTFAVEDSAGMQGFITLREHFADAWEIHCIAVQADARNKGLGSLLLANAERWLADRRVRFLQVKTIAATHPS